MAKITKLITKETTWGDIQKAVDNGKASSFKVGTIVADTLKDGREMPFVLAAVTHYQKDELIFINMENYGDHCMNKKDTNKGGWNKSEMRRHANEDILALLSDDLRKIIAPRTIIEIENDGTRTESVDKLWGLSTMEVSGDWWSDNDNGEDKQLPYLKEGANRVLREAGTGAVCGWWERSPRRSGSYYFYGVYTSGLPSSNYWASSQLGVCLGFTIRRRQNQKGEIIG